jgi:mono/diheme cytochrome c family protein
VDRYYLAVSLLSVACTGGGSTGDSRLYAERHADGNTFACATCHALDEPAADGYLRPGHPIGDAAARPSFKNGQLTELRDAVNSCRTEWMAAPPFAAGDPRWLELESFLVDRAPASAPALTYDRIDPPVDLDGGDADRGRALFNSRCIVCHGEDGGGTERAPRVTGLALEPDYVAERVRTSGDADSPIYPGLTGGRMPFWAADRLSDDELRDIVAYVESSEAPDTGSPDAGVPDAGDDRDCDATHPRVGQVAELTTRFHGVSGTATIVDDCTVTIEMFDFDGEGVDVRVYGAAGGNYENGFAMTGDLRRAGGYTGETITATLPPGASLDQLDGISIWCVPVGASFGDGLFGPP